MKETGRVRLRHVYPLYYGMCVAVVARKAGSSAPIVLTAKAAGLKGATVTFR